MCGISGVYGLDLKRESPVYDFVSGMVDAMADRGPDNRQVKVEDSAVLGHTRLAIMHPHNSAANQPVSGSRWTIVYNGEIYNFRDLKKELVHKKIEFSTDSDTEVLLQSIEYHGVDETLRKINGIFAFAAYDRLEKKLVLARDHLGVKPLYYWWDDERNYFWFASTPAAIANSGKDRWAST